MLSTNEVSLFRNFFIAAFKMMIGENYYNFEAKISAKVLQVHYWECLKRRDQRKYLNIQRLLETRWWHNACLLHHC